MMLLPQRNIKAICLLLYIFISLLQVNAQPDSLRGKSSAEKLLELSVKFKDTDALKAMGYAQQAIAAAQKENLPLISIKANLFIGRIRHTKNELPEAYEAYNKALQIAAAIKDSIYISRCYHNIGDVYKALGMFDESVMYLKKALHIAEQIRDSADIAAFADRLGHVCMDHGEVTGQQEFFDKALEYYNYGLAINKKTNNTKRLCNSYINLANAYAVFLRHNGDTSNVSISVGYSLQGLAIAEKNELWTDKGLNLLNIGETYLSAKRYDEALVYFNKAYSLYDSIKIKLWCAVTLRDFALAYQGKKQFDKAIHCIEESNRLTKEFSNSEQHENYLLLSQLYEAKKDFPKAFAAYKKYEELLQLDLNTKTTLELERLQMAYDSQEKDREIKFLNGQKKLVEEKHKKDTIINYVLLGAILLVVAVAALLFNRSRILQRSKELSDNARIMQEQFLANTSHEVRTPMNGIIGMANQLMNTPLSIEQKQYVEVMKKSSDNLLRIINDILDLSKIKAGKLEFYERPFEPAKLFNEIRLSLDPRAREKDLLFEFIISPDVPQVLIGDALRVEQILVNLLDNALKFTQQGKISLTVKPKELANENCVIEFCVRDTGSGIPPEHKQHIFESFYQLENAGQRKHGGVGLGLSIVKYLVENQHGTISVVSEEGRGTAFNFCIPFKTGETLLPGEKIRNGEKKDLAFASILVVEDNVINQKVIDTTLQNWNCQYTIVSSAVECFDELEKSDYEMILMDIELPGISGMEATKYIRNKFKGAKRNIPVVALTAYAFESEKIKCLSAGMSDVVIKPFSPDALYTVISRVLAGNNISEDTLLMNKIACEECSDLKHLSLRYKDSPEEFRELLKLFKEEIPVYMEELKLVIAEKDAEGLKKIIHKMKSPLHLAGAGELVQKLDVLSTDNRTGNNDLLLSEINVMVKNLMSEIDSCAVVLSS